MTKLAEGVTIDTMTAIENAVTIPKEVVQEVNLIGAQVLALRVINNETYLQAGEIFNAIRAMEKKIEAFFEPLCKKADEAHKALTSAKREELAKLKPLKDHINSQQTLYNIEQEGIRRKKEEILRQEALKREEEERLQAALQAEKEGNKAEAEAILEEPVFIPVPIVEKTVPKVAGQTMTTIWKWRIFKEILIPREYLCVDEIKINGVVRALKDKTNINGIEIYPEQSMRGVRK